MKKKQKAPTKKDRSASLAVTAGSALWNENGFITAPDGTEYCIQRESDHGAQFHGWLYYPMRRRKGEQQMTNLMEHARRTETAVERIIERLISEPNAEIRNAPRKDS